MHEGFVNYNAGTLGASMVEGRISAGVVVGDGSDIGGGASIMGTLSGGGKEVISIGERCLLGANAGIGISLGDDCVVEAGCYVTAGTKVTIKDIDSKPKVIKAAELSGRRQRAVPPQLGERRHRGAARGPRGHQPQRRAAQQLTRTPPLPPMRFRYLVFLVVLAVVVGVGVATLARVRPAARPRGLHGHARRPPGRPHHRAGRERHPDRRDRGPAAGCRPGRSRSRWPRRTRRARSATSTTATATRWACSSSVRRRAGARRSRCATPTTRPTRSTTRWRRSRTTRRCGSPRRRRRCSAPASPRPTRTTRSTPARWPRCSPATAPAACSPAWCTSRRRAAPATGMIRQARARRSATSTSRAPARARTSPLAGARRRGGRRLGWAVAQFVVAHGVRAAPAQRSPTPASVARRAATPRTAGVAAADAGRRAQVRISMG